VWAGAVDEEQLLGFDEGELVGGGGGVRVEGFADFEGGG